MEKAKKETIKTSVMLAIIFALMGLCTFMGIQAITNSQSTKFNLGVVYGANYAVVVEMKTGAGENDFITIFDSTNPANINTAYIQSISNDTIRFNPEHLYLTGSTGIATFRVTAKEDENSGGTNLQCFLTCGDNETKSDCLFKDASSVLTIATGLDSSTSQPESTDLGSITINLSIVKFIPKLAYILEYSYHDYSLDENVRKIIYDSANPVLSEYVTSVEDNLISLNLVLLGNNPILYIYKHSYETRDLYAYTSITDYYGGIYYQKNIPTDRVILTEGRTIDNWVKVGENTGYYVTTRESNGRSPNITFFYKNGTSDVQSVSSRYEHYGFFAANVEAIQLNAYATSAYMHYVMNGVEDVLSHNGSNLPSEKLYLTGDLEFTGEWSAQNCILAETMILMADGTEKAIGDIVVGDVILSYDWETMQLIENPVIYASSQDDTVDWTTIRWFERKFRDDETGEITIIKNAFAHRFYNVTQGGFVYLDLWEIGDKILKQDGTTATLISVEKVYGDCTFARITGQFGANYFANGCLSGDRNCPWGLDLDALQYPTQYTFPN